MGVMGSRQPIFLAILMAMAENDGSGMPTSSVVVVRFVFSPFRSCPWCNIRFPSSCPISPLCVCVCVCASVLGCFSSSLPLSPLVASVRHWHDSKSADLPVHPNQSLMKPGMQSARCATGDRQQHPARVPSLPPFVPAQKSPTLVQSC